MIEASESPVTHDGLNDLIFAVASGDASAFEQLYRSTSPRLFGICLRVLPQRAEAEEVLQEVFITIWRKASQYDATRAGAMTWLAMMTRNKAIDRLRANASERSHHRIEFDEAAAAPGANQATEKDQDRHRLDACLDELEPSRRMLIRTAFFEGATYEELAERSSTPLGTIKSWIRRGLLKLKTCLER